MRTRYHDAAPLLGELCVIAGSTTLAGGLIALLGGTALAVVLTVGLALMAWGLYEIGLLG